MAGLVWVAWGGLGAVEWPSEGNQRGKELAAAVQCSVVRPVQV